MVCLKNVFILLISLINLTSSAQEIHVSPRGNDLDPGTTAKPVGSIERARDILRNTKGFRTIILHEGNYELRSSLIFNELDSNLVIKPAPENKVTITGGRILSPSAFTSVKNKNILSRLSKDARPFIKQIDLKKQGIHSFGTHQQYGHALPVIPSTIELFFNDEPMVLAQYPNKGGIKIGKIIDKGSVPRIGDKSNRGAVFQYTDDRHKKWIGLSDIWIQGTLNYGFADDYNSIANIDTIQKTITLKKPHLYGVSSGKDFQQYIAINILEELDQPGEWYLDRTTGMLYFWPPSVLSNAKILVSILEDPVISLEGVKNFQLQRITIEGGRGIGIYMERCSNTLVAGCTIRNVGTSGIFMGQGAKSTDENSSVDDYEGTPISRQVGSYQNHLYSNSVWNRNAGSNNGILSCDVYNTGSGGICLSGGDKKTLTPGNSYVTNCKIYNFTRRNKFTWAGLRVDGCGNKVSNNEIFNSDWHGIFVQGNDHVFEYNYIHDVTLNSDDTSPWYIGRNPSDRGNIVRYNYFDNCGSKNRMNMGIYCDDSSSDILVFGNVFNNMMTNHGVVFSNTGWDIVVKNNIIINPLSHSVVNSAHYYTWATSSAVPMFGKDGLIRKRLTSEIDFTQPPYSIKYPALLPYLNVIVDNKEWQGMRSRGNIFEQNLIIGGPEEPLHLMGGKYAQTSSRSNWVTQEDPGFVNMKEKNFMLKPDAKVFDQIQGFQPIPFEKIGLLKDVFRK